MKTVIKQILWCSPCGTKRVTARKTGNCTRCKQPMKETGFITEVV